ncbi:uncharacterized protein LOC121992611 [Zingiber officinale]|uniref:Protein-S-isoprenylcysteine O-methyltransferase n=1 Tax=Zingiber officinale TaxID=94328 RepID=A0A8J5KZ76_ZINOF|nr:uncharacterized protein LOC121992611 [Zingiber officinale]KAG6495985.1 hypothetical protein ZIOFF_043832 [Zingiber officinale]
MEAAVRFLHFPSTVAGVAAPPRLKPRSLPSLRRHLNQEFPSSAVSVFRPFPFHLSLRPYHKHLAPSPKALSLPLPLPPLDVDRITPLAVCKWSAVLALALVVTKKTIGLLLDPFFWTYFSWSWIFWPWISAVALGFYGLHCARLHSLGLASPFQQIVVVTAAVAWLTVVPPAHFNGFLEGWPILLFFVYQYFFFFESSVRRRLYGDLYPRPHDSKWDVRLPRPFQVGFSILVLVGHWLAAYEGPELHLIPGGWANAGIWVLILMTLFMRYHSVLYLAKYSEKVAVPMEVVQFGPYRWVRHPIYASTMLLFAVHCITLRAPLSLLFLCAVCAVYYGRKADLEEELMLESFGERYENYMNKVRYRLIPFVY